MSEKDIVSSFCRDTGLPAVLLVDDMRLEVSEVRAALEKRVMGQPEAIRRVADVIGISEVRSTADAVMLVMKHGYNRLPVYRGNITNLKGVMTLSTWDLLDESIEKRPIGDFIQPPLNRPFMGVPRTSDIDASDSGQWGAALRWLAGFGNTEFGFYFMNYHSRLPTINGTTGPISIVPELTAVGTATTLWSYYLFGVPPGLDPVVDATVAAYAQAASTAVYANSAEWYTAYPEDIKLYGLSWNAQLGTSGIAFQGEVSYRQDNPLQMDDVEILFAALSPISAGLAAVNQVAPGGRLTRAHQQALPTAFRRARVDR